MPCYEETITMHLVLGHNLFSQTILFWEFFSVRTSVYFVPLCFTIAKNCACRLYCFSNYILHSAICRLDV